MNNGRVSDINDKCENIEQLYSEVNNGIHNYKKESINHLFEKNNVNQCFFSKDNLNHIQNNIRYEVYNNTNFTIDRQSDRELSLIMRSMYLQYSSNNDSDIMNEINYLNKLVINYCVPKIITNLKQYIGYKKDLNTLYTPMDKPENTNLVGKGNFELELNKPF